MSFTKNDQVFHIITDQELIEIIAYNLRKDFGSSGSSIKEIARKINVNPRIVRNWYEAKNMPNLTNFLCLLTCSPHLMKSILELLDNNRFTDNIPKENYPINRHNKSIYGDNSVTVNVTLRKNILLKLNQRQLWFLGVTQKGLSLKVDDITNTWDVNMRTAKRDIAGLIECNLIKFSGASKNGRYILT